MLRIRCWCSVADLLCLTGDEITSRWFCRHGDDADDDDDVDDDNGNDDDDDDDLLIYKTHMSRK